MNKQFATVAPTTSVSTTKTKKPVISQTADQSAVADKLIAQKVESADVPTKKRRTGGKDSFLKNFFNVGSPAGEAQNEETTKQIVQAAVEMSQAQRAYDAVREAAITFAQNGLRIISADQHDVFVKPARIREQIATAITTNRIAINPSIIEYPVGGPITVNGSPATNASSIKMSLNANIPTAARVIGWSLVAETMDLMQSPGNVEVTTSAGATGSAVMIDHVSMLLKTLNEKGQAAFMPGIRSQKVYAGPTNVVAGANPGEYAHSAVVQDIDGDVELSLEQQHTIEIAGSNVRVFLYPIIMTSEIQDALLAQLDTGSVSTLVKQFVNFVS